MSRTSGLKLAATLVCLVATVGAGYLTALFVRLSQAEPSPNFSVPSPQMVLLTNQPKASVTYSIDYYRGSVTSPGETQFGPADSVAPVGTRRMNFQVHVPGDVRQVQFAVLLNSDGSMTDVAGIQGLGFVYSTNPGGELQSPCPSIQSFATAQVLSGVAEVDSSGDATIDIVGGIPNYVRYPNNGDRTPVNVIQMIPATGGAVGSSSNGSCTVNLINWEQVGGIPWVTPKVADGSVSIGSVPAGKYIESSNPPVVDAQSLSWSLQGAADVSYTLFDSDSQSSHELWLFWAGITAGLGATLFLEFIKGSAEAVWPFAHRSDDQTPLQISSTSPPTGQNSSSKDQGSSAMPWLAFVAGIFGGIVFGRRYRHRDDFAKRDRL